MTIEGLDASRVEGSFKVHLFVDGTRIASRFMLQPSGEQPDSAAAASRNARFDFVVPLDAVRKGKLYVKVEPLQERARSGAPAAAEVLSRSTLSVRLLLRPE